MLHYVIKVSFQRLVIIKKINYFFNLLFRMWRLLNFIRNIHDFVKFMFNLDSLLLYHAFFIAFF